MTLAEPLLMSNLKSDDGKNTHHENLNLPKRLGCHHRHAARDGQHEGAL